MPRPLFVDTAFVIALLNAKDSFHRIACRLLADFVSHPLITTDAVLLEIGNALARQADDLSPVVDLHPNH